MKLFKSTIPYVEPDEFPSHEEGGSPTIHHGEIDGKFYISLHDDVVAAYKAAQPEDGGLVQVSTQAEKDKVKAGSDHLKFLASVRSNAVRMIANPIDIAEAQLVGDTQYDAALAAVTAAYDAAVEAVFPAPAA